ncbi:hypothetical protein [Arthrobacter sp. ok909]|uniref:hypothetical protein n=1 Tax=Arthrobacter sp. ok909 TaxID=1761746 RepID=UPI0015879223|nr:hypothetical protein [Arthrobacter sp. ok909]
MVEAAAFLLTIPAAFALKTYTPFLWLLLVAASCRWLARRFSTSAEKWVTV